MGSDHTSGYQFLNKRQASIVTALTERIFPSDESGPGSIDAGVVTFIDRSLAGAYTHLQGHYVRGLQMLDDLAKRERDHPFLELQAAEQDALLRALFAPGALQAPGADREMEELRQFFLLVCQHTREGLFCDPVHGGNRDFVMWEWLGYSGPQLEGFTQEEATGDATPSRPIKSAADWI